MLARVGSGALVGVDAVRVEVEVDMTLGLPYFNVVGLPDGAAKESKVRVISAIKNSGYELPNKRVTVNLAPADLRKEGAAFELPIALGVLAAARAIAPEPLAKYLFAGELSLDGVVKPIRGVLPLALAARKYGFEGVVVPRQNAAEAALVEGLAVYPVEHLRDAVAHLAGDETIERWRRSAAEQTQGSVKPDMSEVRGQEHVKGALEMAAAGGHNILMRGPPGSGKTMLARRLPGILPAMTFEEALEVTKIYSVMGLLREDQGLVRVRPFRSPHHTISDAGLVGGGVHTRPGELSLAHHGVLFLDEFPEFRKNVLEVLRQPLEEQRIHLARANHNLVYPCQVMLVAAMNPCPCGYHGVYGHKCKCNWYRVQEYKQRISGPLLDRIDILIQTEPVSVENLVALQGTERPSSYYRDRVEAARERQRHRFRGERGIHNNATVPPGLLRRYCVATAAAQDALTSAVNRFRLSARAHDGILKLARSRADLEGHADIELDDMYFAISSRKVERDDVFDQPYSGEEPANPGSKEKRRTPVVPPQRETDETMEEDSFGAFAEAGASSGTAS